MQDRDISAREENPAQSRKTSGKSRENGLPGELPGLNYAFGGFLLDTAQHRLLRHGEVVPLRNRPYEVLLYLLRRQDRLVEQSELLASIWGAEDVYHDALRKAVGSIRTALGDGGQQPRFIETHWGKGYRFIGNALEVKPDAPPASGPIREDSASAAESVSTQATAAHPSLASRPAIAILPRPKVSWRFPHSAGALALSAGLALVFAVVTAALLRENTPVSQTRGLLKAVPSANSANATEAERTAYRDAQYLLSQRTSSSIEEAMQRFQQIVRANDRSADAYAGLAECYGLGYWGFWKIDPALALTESADLALKAVQADPDSAYAHAQLAAALLRQLKIHEARAEFLHALRIHPDDAEVLHAYAVFLDDTGHADAGIQEMKRAIELQPLSLAYKTDLGMSYFFANRYADAIATYQSVLKLNPNYIEAHDYLASMYVFEGEWRQARAEYATLDRLSGARQAKLQSTALRVITLLRTGERKEAVAEMHAILGSPSIEHDCYLAIIYAQLGRKDDALRFLRRVGASHSLTMLTIADNPLLKPMRGDPEFERMVRKVREFKAVRPNEPATETASLDRTEPTGADKSESLGQLR
jgi:DNA-binding winged helix-turn-helix (wHTH) protein/Flp pilus assembly protein TadD